MHEHTTLQSGVLTSPADALLAQAITATLCARATDRARLFTQCVADIERYMAELPAERPWTCVVYRGTDGSHIFRGGVGHSLVFQHVDFDGCENYTELVRQVNNLPYIHQFQLDEVLVIDPEGRLWRARSYEDFDTTYNISGGTCTIATLTPRFEQMRAYTLR